MRVPLIAQTLVRRQ